MFSRHASVSLSISVLLGVLLGLAVLSFGRAQVGFSLTGTFTDVPLIHPASTAIEYLVQKGIIGGYPDGTFKPEQEINRAEFTKIVIGTHFLPLDTEGCLSSIPQELLYTQALLFPDVARHQWFAKYVCRAKVAGIVAGYPDGTFRPATNVNFVEAAKILANSFALPLDPPSAGAPWYRPYTEALANRSAIPLSIASFDQRITRAEVAEMIYRLHADIRSLASLTQELLLSPPPENFVPSPPSPSPPSPSPPLHPSFSLSPTSFEYSQRIVTATGGGTFTIDVITADLDKGIRAVTVAANERNCTSDCPASPLANFVQRLGGIAGINGTYFCPPDQLYCVGQRNSFFSFIFNGLTNTFLNENMRTLRGAGGLFVFRPGSITFFRDPAEFPLDYNITGAIASWPILLVGNKIVLDPLSIDERQRTVAANRNALGNKGNMLYLISARGVTFETLARIMQTMELENGINLDGEGSSALYYRSAYKVGPGRPIPNALILVP